MSRSIQNIGSIEAADYLKITLRDLIDYTYRGLICYKLNAVERFYSRQELDRFNKEVLLQEKKL